MGVSWGGYESLALPVAGVRDWSPELRAMFGVPDGLAPDYDAYVALVHPDDLHRTRNLIQQTIDDGLETGYAAEFRMRHAGGTWLWVLARGNVVERDTDGQPLLISLLLTFGLSLFFSGGALTAATAPSGPPGTAAAGARVGLVDAGDPSLYPRTVLCG